MKMKYLVKDTLSTGAASRLVGGAKAETEDGCVWAKRRGRSKPRFSRAKWVAPMARKTNASLGKRTLSHSQPQLPIVLIVTAVL